MSTILVARMLSALLCATFMEVSFSQQNSEPPAQKASFAVEADAAAYALKGYSVIGRITLRKGLNVALGTGRYNVPGFVVKGDSNYDRAKWKATSESIQVFRIGYRFRGPMKNGPVVDAIVLNQKWRLQSETIGGETRFRQIGAGVSGGYYFHLGKHFYIYPTASLTRHSVYSGETTVRGISYRLNPTQLNGSVHVGWEF